MPESNDGFTVGPTGMMEQVVDTGMTPEQQAEQDILAARVREAELAAAEVEKNIEQEHAQHMKRIQKEQKRLEDGTKGLAIGRIVEYRSRTGNYSVAAIVNCTVDSIYQPGVESGNVPALTSPDRIHITVFTPGKPGMRGDADNFVVASEEEVSENVAGCYQEWNIPYDPDGGPGTWRWPARV